MSKPTDQPTSTQAKAMEDQKPLLVDHGRKIAQGIHKTRQAVATTIANTQTILDLLSPNEEEEDPILAALDQIILGQRHQQVILEEILKRLEGLEGQQKSRSR